MTALLALWLAVGLPLDVSAPAPTAAWPSTSPLVLEAQRPASGEVVIVHRHTGSAPQAYVVAWRGGRCAGPVDEVAREGRPPRRCAGSTPEVRTLAPGESWTTTVRLPRHPSEGVYRHTIRYRVTPAETGGRADLFTGEATVEVRVSIRS